jgi:hypothetical protein
VALEELRVTRLDVARDFSGVENPAATLEALVGMPRKWARTEVVHFDPKELGTQTLSISSGTACMARLYDESAHTAGAVPLAVSASKPIVPSHGSRRTPRSSYWAT